jgi:hypothetical protein
MVSYSQAGQDGKNKLERERDAPSTYMQIIIISLQLI